MAPSSSYLRSCCNFLSPIHGWTTVRNNTCIYYNCRNLVTLFMYVPLLLCLKIFLFYNDLPFLLRLYFYSIEPYLFKPLLWFAHSSYAIISVKMSQVLHSVLSFRNKEFLKQNIPNVQRLRTYMYPEFSDLAFTAPFIFGIVKCKMFLIVINCWNCSLFHVLLFY